MKIERIKTRATKLGNLVIGDGNPIRVQSMTNTLTQDINATTKQVRQLISSGCEIVRIAVPDMKAAKAIREIKKNCTVPLIADIHFDYKLALAAIESGVDGLRLNPGNIGSVLNVEKVVERAKEKQISIRIGVNSGSLAKDKLEKYGVTANGLVESALEHIAILERLGYYEIKVSVKAASVMMTIDAYRLLSEKVPYPLHLGVTEAGTELRGTAKSSVALAILLSEGIGDTIRVSLTADPVKEVIVGLEILKSLGLKKGLNVVSCPTCGRTEIDLIALTQEVEKRLVEYQAEDMIVAVMGCIVNGPGEAGMADFGIAGGKKEGLVFSKGHIVKKVPEHLLLEELMKLIEDSIK
ncbi:MAG: flavodoxin-dependent (E)-4-hydroxy-3-methylbut-2-enyl-diphosphate synthase [Candidatus Cloacimonetes bacterium]|nr:flavodoxin-dependent (E)-4-hydroxy-3-methylbut-2-enyl-diphosphate synthase [Candidatus Cloacimonadota bacterium]